MANQILCESKSVPVTPFPRSELNNVWFAIKLNHSVGRMIMISYMNIFFKAHACLVVTVKETSLPYLFNGGIYSA
jgi:hypothetical protein